MQVQQMIQASANILTITKLSPGNVYKRVDESTYNGTGLKFGVVQDVMNNGEDSAVTALEYEADYNEGAKATLKVFTGSKPAAIFPAQPEEVISHLSELMKSTEAAVRRAEDDLQKKRQALAAVERMRSTIGQLEAPETAAGVIEATVVEDLVDQEPIVSPGELSHNHVFGVDCEDGCPVFQASYVDED